MTTQTVQPSIWIQHDAEQAIRFYTGLLPDSEVLAMQHIADPYGNSTLIASFKLGGVIYQAIGGPAPFALNESFSISVECTDQAEADRYWDALVDGGTPSQCGWLKDRWGLSWQIVPRQVIALVQDPNPERAEAARQAMYQMQRLIVADMQAAADTVVPAN
ncbi:MAG: VOC family protein [Microbacteriaceae bacterium]